MADRQATAWFHVDGDAEYYARGIRCGVGMYRVTKSVPRPALSVFHDFLKANHSFDDRQFAALQISNFSPDDLLDVVNLGGDTLYSRQLQAALRRGAACSDGLGAAFQRAYHRPGATLVYRDRDTTVMILDPAQMRLFVVQAQFL